MLGATQAAPEPKRLPEVASIKFEGEHHFSEGQLRKLMRSASPSWRHPFRHTPYLADRLQQDIVRLSDFYRDQGYLQARVWLIEARPSDDGRKVRIRIGVEEGEVTRVAAIRFVANQTLSEDDLDDVLETKVGKPYSATRVDLDRQRLIDLYADNGRPYTTVEDSVASEGLTATVGFIIHEGPATHVRRVVIEGAHETKHFVIRRELTFKSGDLLKRKKVTESRERLFETGFFRNVRFEPIPADSSSPPQLVDITVFVTERKMGWVLAGVGYNSSNQVRLSGEIGHRNILGNAHRLVYRNRLAFDVDALIKKDQPAIEETRSELSFLEPWLFSTRTSGTFSLFGESTREPTLPAAGVEREDLVGVGFAAERRFHLRSRVRGSIENRWVSQRVLVEQVMGPDTVLVTERQHFVTRSLALFVERDKRNNPFDPSTGSLATFLGEVAGGALGGTSNFLKLTLSGSWYRPMKGVVIAGRLGGGWIHPFGDSGGRPPIEQVPRNERFRAGGATTVRGYPEDSLGPQRITPGQREPSTDRGLATVLANVEMRFPMFWRFSGALFIDSGNVWEEARDVAIKRFIPRWHNAAIEDVRYSTGGGIRFHTPVGPLRLDYGYSLTRGEPEREIQALHDGEWHLSLGQAF